MTVRCDEAKRTLARSQTPAECDVCGASHKLRADVPAWLRPFCDVCRPRVERTHAVGRARGRSLDDAMARVTVMRRLECVRAGGVQGA